MIISEIIDAQVLIALERHLNFRAAAASLHMPAASFSRRLQKMEERAGVKLFTRSSRAVNTTEAVLAILDHARRMVEEAESVETILARSSQRIAGDLKVTAPTILGQALLAPAIGSFLKAYPEVNLSIDLSDRAVDFITEGFDVGLRVGPSQDESLISKNIGLVTASLYASESTLRILGPIEDIETLADKPLALLHHGMRSAPSLILTDKTGENHTIDLQPRLIAMNPWLLMALARSDEMIAVLPDILLDRSTEPLSLKRILPSYYARSVPVSITFPSRKLIAPHVRAFIDFMVKELSKLNV
ncbi:MAG: LysR family transcriptional regulator [Parasphingorhabdus sp.]